MSKKISQKKAPTGAPTANDQGLTLIETRNLTQRLSALVSDRRRLGASETISRYQQIESADSDTLATMLNYLIAQLEG